MARIIIVDDTPNMLEDYRDFMKGNEVHVAAYLDSMIPMLKQMMFELGVDYLKQQKGVSSAGLYSHVQLVEFIKANHEAVDKVIIDGLDGMCFGLVTELFFVPREKLLVYSSNHSLVDRCKRAGFPADYK